MSSPRNPPRQRRTVLAAFASLQSGDIANFEALLARNPHLAGTRNKRQHAAQSRGEHRRQAGPERRPVPIKALLEAGSDVNEGNDRGWTPLHAAAYTNQSDMAASLIEMEQPWMRKRTARAALL